MDDEIFGDDDDLAGFVGSLGFLKMGDHQDHRFQYYDLDDSGVPPLEETSIIFHFLTAR